ncbi:MAG: diguanylate cyclase [Candidatus Omnitrophica bacterium]|nr:diguanylate cyclase [Candidatus Omnitrophota bacterium]
MTDTESLTPPRRPGATLTQLLLMGTLLIAGVVSLARQSAALQAFLLGGEDRLLRLSHALLPPAPPAGLAVVTLDEATAQRLGTPPWPREIYARFLQQLCQRHPRVIAMDFVFVGHEAQDAGDDALAGAMRACGNVLLPSHIDEFGRHVSPEPTLAAAALGYGIVNKPHGADFVVRRGRTWWSDARGVFVDYAFEVKAAAVMLDVPLPRIERLERAVLLRGPRGTVTLPSRRDGTVPIRYAYLPSEITTLNFAEVLEGRLPAEAVRDKLVLVGLTFRDRDVHRTPLGPMPGLHIIANTVLMFLSGRSLVELPFPLELLMLWLLALLTLLLTYRLPARHSAALVGLGVAGALGLHLTLWWQGLLWHWSLPVGVMGLVYASTSLYRSVVLHRETAALKRQAITDELTQLFTFRYWQLRLRLEIERVRRYQAPLSLLMLDIDHFKQVNDTYGHLAGNAVLQTVATLLREALRTTDIPGRYGGEEFGVMLPHTNAAGASICAENIRRRIAEYRFTLPNHPEGLRVTISVGVAALDELGLHTAEELIQVADEALYAAKHAGRNRVVMGTWQTIEAGQAIPPAPPERG